MKPIIIVLILVIASGSAYFAYTNGYVGSIKQDISSCDKLTDNSAKIACIIQVAAQNRDETLCNRLDVATIKDGCILAVAVAKKDTSLCDTLSNVSKQMSAQDKICKAMITLNTKYCDEINTPFGASTFKGVCYAFIVEKKKDPTLCKKLTDEVAKKYCVLTAVNISADVKYCDPLSDGGAKGECYAFVVEKKKDPSLCKTLTDETAKGYCAIAAASVSADITYCNVLSEGSSKGTCYGVIVEKKNSTEICDRLTTDTSKKYCYPAAINVLGYAQDISWCKIIGETKYDQAPCIEKYAIATGNWQYCSEAYLPIESSRWPCYSGAGIKAKDPEACEKAGHGDFRDKCLIAVAGAKQDITICERLSYDYRRYAVASDMGYCASYDLDMQGNSKS